MEETAIKTTPLKSRSRGRLSKIWHHFKEETPFAIGSIPFVWQFLFFFLPMLTIIATGFIKYNKIGHIQSISLDSFKHILTYSYFKVALNSFALAGATSVCCLLIGFPLAYFMASLSNFMKKCLLFLLIIPFWTNFILHIYAWYFVLEKDGFLNNFLSSLGVISTPLHALNTKFAILLMMIYFYLPFMILPIFSSLEKFNTNYLKASLDLGANKYQTICRILIPLTKNALKTGIFLVFIPSFGEFVIPELMGGDKIAFVGSVISMLVMTKSTVSYGLAYTILSTILLFATLLLLNLSINRITARLAGGTK